MQNSSASRTDRFKLHTIQRPFAIKQQKQETKQLGGRQHERKRS